MMYRVLFKTSEYMYVNYVFASNKDNWLKQLYLISHCHSLIQNMCNVNRKMQNHSSK